MGKLAEAFVELSTRDDKLRGGLSAARGKLVSWASSARSTLTIPITIGGAILASGATKFLVDAAQAATTLGETINKVKVTFGQSADAMIRDAEQLSKEFGIVRNVSLEAASNFGLIAQGAGMAEAESARLSTGLVRLAADAASFYNVPIDVALDKIRAGLIGEAEPLRSFGMNLSAAAVDAKALEMGLASTSAELGDYERMGARAVLITEGLAKASGDLERTADSNANATRRVSGRLEEFKTNVGEGLQEAMGDLLVSLEDALKAMEELFSPERVATFGAAVSSVIGLTAKMGGELADGQGAGMFETLGHNAMAGLLDAAGLISNVGGLIPDNALSRGFRGRAWEHRSAVIASTTATWDPTQGGGGPGAAAAIGPGGGGGGIPRIPSDPRNDVTGLGVASDAIASAVFGAMQALAVNDLMTGAAGRMAELEAVVDRPRAMSVGDQLGGYGRMQLDALNSGEDAQEKAVKELGEIRRLLEEMNNKPEATPAQRLGTILRGRS